jgi:hypothetical protein
MVPLLALAFIAQATTANPIQDLSVSTQDTDFPDVMQAGVALAPWNANQSSSIIDDSSYLEFIVKSVTPYNVTVLGETSELFSVIPFVFTIIPEPHMDKKHVAQVLHVCSEGETFYLYFDCINEGSAIVSIDFSEQATRSKFAFTKTCAKEGIRHDLQIFVDDDPVVINGTVTDVWDIGEKTLHGTVAFRLSIGQGNQYLESVTVTSPQLDVTARGPGAIGGYLTKLPLDVVVLVKDCKTGTVHLTLRMPPYDTLRISWKNVCEVEELSEVEATPEVNLKLTCNSWDGLETSCDETFPLTHNSTLIKAIPVKENTLTFSLSSSKLLPLSKPLLTFKQ